MAVAAFDTMMQDRRGQVSELEGFLVPKILRVNLKKKAEDRSNSAGGSDDENGGCINRTVDSPKIIENVQKNLAEIGGNESSTGICLDSKGDEEEVIEMAPERHQIKGNDKQSSYLLQPFLKPVASEVKGGAADNPILKALFGGSNSSGKPSYGWVTEDKTVTNNCHPFKKTDLSRDIVHDSTPVQVPKSLSREDKRQRSPQSRSDGNGKSRPVNRGLKENRASSVSGVVTSTVVTTAEKARSLTKHKSTNEKEKENRPVTLEELMTTSSSATSKGSHSRGRNISLSSLKKIGYVNSERLMKLRVLVDNAIKNHKIYSMTGCYTSVRNALKQRGWIEKIDSDIKGKRKHNRFEEIGIYDAAFHFVEKFPTLAAMRYSKQTQSGFSHNDEINYSGQGEAEIINRMLRNINEDLCWLSRPYPYYCWKDIGKFDLVNRLPKAYFSNKIGLCNSLQHIQWYFEPGVCSTQYPRTYNMSQKDEYEAFKDDFRMTACISLLKWLTATYRSGGERAVRSADGKVDACIVDFALKRCTEYVKYREHEDIDLPETSHVWEYQWDHFIIQYYKIINEGQILKECKSDPSIQVYVTNSLSMLNLIRGYWPQINIDGYHNFWVIKPGGRCCGNGIVIKNNLEQILMLVNPSVTRETRYVVQKYIEKPLLIYNTKFDIRQWFLVTSVYPLTVWMYRESYLRFCSQPFSLKNMHESIHLCNNAVQRRYKNSKRDRGLPDENMWDCYTFQTYLKSIGYPDAWEKYIYPGMKEGFIGALLASQDTMERRKNCFELYGADFMISETLTDGPWLIEINSNPAMDSSTSVTARMCPQVLEDIVKVVIDRRDDKNASTGAFEMVFKQHCPPVPPYLGMSLSIKGQKVNRANGGETKPTSKKSKNPNSCGKSLQSETEDSQSEDPNEARSEFRQESNGLEKLEPDKGKTVLSSEMLEGLKKEILRAKFSIRMLNRDKGSLSRVASDVLRVEDVYDNETDRYNIRRSTSENLKLPLDFEFSEVIEKGKKDAEENRDEVEESSKTLPYLEEVLEAEEVTPEFVADVKRDLSRISESGESLTEHLNIDESQHSLCDISSDDPETEMLKECRNQVTVQTCIVCPKPTEESCLEEIHPVQYVERTETVRESVANMESEADTDDEAGPSDAGKYIIKQEVKPPPIRKIRRNNSGRPDYKRRWKQSRRKNIDYVRKNIEDVRVMQGKPKSSKIIHPKPPTKIKITPVPKTMQIIDPSDYENIYREELLKMMHSMSSRKFIRQLCGKSPKYWNSHFQVKKNCDQKQTSPVIAGLDVFKRDNNGWKSDKLAVSTNLEFLVLENKKGEEKSESEKVEIPPICSEIASQLGLNKSSPMVGGVSDCGPNLESTARERVSCPSFRFGKDFGEGFFTGRLDGLIGERKIPTERSVSDWRENVETARRACNEILSKLREFNETNSKVRLQQALKKGNDIEKVVADGYLVYRAAKGFAKVGRKHLGRYHTEAEETSAKSNSNRFISICDIGRKKNLKGLSSPKSDSGLAISTENGAARKVARTLPKIQQWTFLDGSGLNS